MKTLLKFYIFFKIKFCFKYHSQDGWKKNRSINISIGLFWICIYRYRIQKALEITCEGKMVFF